MTVNLVELYFAKAYEDFNYRSAWRKLVTIGGTSAMVNDELFIKVEELGLGLYDYKGLTCVSLNGAVALDGFKKVPKRRPAKWKMSTGRFLEVVETIETVLHGQGSPFQCRAHFVVDLKFAEIEVRAFFADHTLWPDTRRGGKPRWRLAHPYITPRFIVRFK